MRWIIETSLRLRVLVVALAIALLAIGVRTADQVPLDVFPEFAPPVVEIQTEVPGISTEEVESLVTVPIENSLHGVPYVKTVRSGSVLGLSSVRLIFATGTDLLTARQLVQERLATVASTLPAVVPAAHPATLVITQSLPQDRALERRCAGDCGDVHAARCVTPGASPDGHDRCSALDDSTASDVGARRGQCGHVG